MPAGGRRSFEFNPSSGGFLRGVMGFVREDAAFGRRAAAAFFPAQFFEPGPLGRGLRRPPGFQLLREHFAHADAIPPLLPGFLALDSQTGRPVQQVNTGGRLVHVLPAVTAGSDKAFFKVRFPDAERGQTSRQRRRHHRV